MSAAPPPIYTPLAPTEGFFKEKGSKFISHLYPIETKDDIEAHLDTLRRAHHDARHVCYAWRMGRDSRAADDGEPAYSAGAPLLRCLVGAELDYALLAVVRYFGGTKLGVGGLIAAYDTAGQDAIAKAERRRRILWQYATLHYPYTHETAVALWLRNPGVEVAGREFTDSVVLRLRAEPHDWARLLAALPYDLRVEPED